MQPTSATAAREWCARLHPFPALMLQGSSAAGDATSPRGRRERSSPIECWGGRIARMTGRQLVRTLAMALACAVSVRESAAAQIRGTATYRERIALPTDAVFDATLEEVSRADAPAIVLGRARVRRPRTRRSGSRFPSTPSASSPAVDMWCARGSSSTGGRCSPPTGATPCSPGEMDARSPCCSAGRPSPIWRRAAAAHSAARSATPRRRRIARRLGRRRLDRRGVARRVLGGRSAGRSPRVPPSSRASSRAPTAPPFGISSSCSATSRSSFDGRTSARDGTPSSTRSARGRCRATGRR